MKVIIKEVKREYNGIFKVDKVILQHEKFDGSMSKEIVRLNFDRGNIESELPLKFRCQRKNIKQSAQIISMLEVCFCVVNERA